MQPEFDDFKNFTQGFGFPNADAIFEAGEFWKTHQVGFFHDCNTRVEIYTR